MVHYELIAILGIFVLSVGAVVYLESAAYSATGAGAYASRLYAGPKLYGGGLRQAAAMTPMAFGTAYTRSDMIPRAQAYLYANQDLWDCSFGPEAQTSPHPCVFDYDKERYCCITSGRKA